MPSAQDLQIETSLNTISHCSNSIIYINPKSGDEVTVEEVKELCDVLTQYGTSSLCIVNYKEHTPIFNKDARDLAARDCSKYLKAVAVVTDSLAIKIIVNFCSNFYKVKVPIKLFRTESKAEEWLLKQ